MFDFSTFTSLWHYHDMTFAIIGAFLWGFGSAILSPCHLGIIPLLGSHAAGYGPFNGESHAPAVREAMLFTFGCFLTIPLIGLIFTLLGQGLALEGHWWTLPVGALLIWLGMDMFRNHSCVHARHVIDVLRRRFGFNANTGAFSLGFGYGLLASGCTIGFITPLILLTLPQGILQSFVSALCFGLGHTLPMAIIGCFAPLARYIIEGHKEPHGHDADGHCLCHTEDGEGCLDEPHKREKIFRRVMAVILVLTGIVFLLHPFLE